MKCFFFLVDDVMMSFKLYYTDRNTGIIRSLTLLRGKYIATQ